MGSSFSAIQICINLSYNYSLEMLQSFDWSLKIMQQKLKAELECKTGSKFFFHLTLHYNKRHFQLVLLKLFKT